MNATIDSKGIIDFLYLWPSQYSPTQEQIEKLLQFGLRPEANDFFVRKKVADHNQYNIFYNILLLRYGMDLSLFDERNRDFFACALIYKYRHQFSELSAIDIAPTLLNCEFPISTAALSKLTRYWLINARAEDITPNICAHLKPHKENILNALQSLPDNITLPALEQIVKYKKEDPTTDSALGRIFWEGDVHPDRGRLKKVFDEYEKRKQAAEKAAQKDEILRKLVSSNSTKFDFKSYSSILTYADQAMRLVREGADPAVCGDNGISLIYRLFHTGSPLHEVYIKELIHHPNFRNVKIHYHSQEGIDHPIDAIIFFVTLGADPALFNIDELLNAIGKYNAWNDDTNQKKTRYLLAARDPNTSLGKICRRHAITTDSDATFLAANDADKKIIAKLNTMCDSFFKAYKPTPPNKKLEYLIKYFFYNKKYFTVTLSIQLAELVIALVKNGANPNLEVGVNPGFFGSEPYRLIDIFWETLHSDKAFSVSDLHELLTFGLDPNLARNPTPFTENDYDYAALLLHCGYKRANNLHYYVEKGKSKLSLLDSILSNLQGKPLQPVDIAFIFDFLNYGVPITLKDQANFSTLLKWLNVISADKLTSNMIEHLKAFKEQLLDEIRKLDNTSALNMLEKMFDDNHPDKKNDKTALGKVFWAGHPELEKGRLGKAYSFFCELKNPTARFKKERQPTALGTVVQFFVGKRELKTELGNDQQNNHTHESVVDFHNKL